MIDGQMTQVSRQVGFVGVFAACCLLGSTACEQTKASEPVVQEPPAVMTPLLAKPFCATLFEPKQIGRLIGVRALEIRPSSKEIPGVGECQLYVHGAMGQIELSLVADCRPEHPRLETHREALVDKPGYRDVALGTGGVYTFENRLHRLVFVMPEPACAVYIAASGLKKDPTSVIGLRVARGLSLQTMPR